MKLLIVLICALATVALALPPTQSTSTRKPPVKIIKSQNWSDGKGNYKFSFTTEDGTYREETGTVKNLGQEDEYILVVGKSIYKEKGITYTTNYKSDVNGYVADTKKTKA